LSARPILPTYGVMTDQVSRPVQILLGLTVLVAVLWFVALRPKSASTTSSGSTPTTSTGPTAPGVKGLTDDVAKARGAAGTGATTTTTPGTGATTTTPRAGATTTTPRAGATTTAPSAPATPVRPTPPTSTAAAPVADRAARALAQHRVLAALFFNPRAADDRAVVRTLRAMRLPRTVTTVAIPLQRAGDYPTIIAKVAVTGSPTLAVFDRHGTAHTLEGYATSTLMRQRIDDALATR
jgi:hypothetical protein